MPEASSSLGLEDLDFTLEDPKWRIMIRVGDCTTFAVFHPIYNHELFMYLLNIACQASGLSPVQWSSQTDCGVYLVEVVRGMCRSIHKGQPTRCSGATL